MLGIGTTLEVYLNCSLGAWPVLCSALLERVEKKFHRDSKSIGFAYKLIGITS